MYMPYVTQYDETNISDTRPRKNMITIGKVDTSDLMMIITRAINISFLSPELKWVSRTHTSPYISLTKVIEKNSSMLDTPPQDKLYRRLQFFNACEQSCIMMIMGGSKMSKTEYDLKAILSQSSKVDRRHYHNNLNSFERIAWHTKPLITLAILVFNKNNDLPDYHGKGTRNHYNHYIHCLQIPMRYWFVTLLTHLWSFRKIRMAYHKETLLVHISKFDWLDVKRRHVGSQSKMFIYVFGI